MNIIKADISHVDQVAPLFDLYRQFYQCPSDMALARSFILERLEQSESIIFMAQDGHQSAQGFVQLYPSFCSVEATKILILYDLYVLSSARGQGVGEALMDQAAVYAKQVNAKRIDLLTGKENVVGQALYEKKGYRRSNEDFLSYSLLLD